MVGAGAKPFIAYAIVSTTDYGAGDEVIYPNPGFPIYESQIMANGAKPVPIHLHEVARFFFRPRGARTAHHAEDAAPDPQLPAQPDRRPALDASELEEIAAGAEEAPPGLGVRGRDLFAPGVSRRFFSIAQVPGMYERTIISDGASKTWAMTGWRIGFTSNPRAGAGVHALDHQHRVLRLADQPVGGGRGDQRAAGCRRGHEAELPRAARSDRRPAEPGAGREVPEAGRRVLRLAERHRGLPPASARRLRGVPQAPAERGRRGACSPTSTSARAFRAKASTCASPTRRRSRRSRPALARMADFIQKNTKKAA